ncbi:MAG: class I SAM-dependent methyltransferase, partial [Bacteroidales bacterium]
AQAVAGRRDPRILDCGTGTGVNLPLLATFGSVTGVDLNAYGLGQARSRGFTRTARATVAALPFGKDTFDVAASIDVLYSLSEDDERRAAAEMWRVLRPGGGVVLNLAAMRILRGDHSVLAEEVRRYDRRRARWLLEQAGFRVERITYSNAVLFPLVLAQRTVERVAGLSSPDSAARNWTVPPRPLNALLDGALALEAAAQRVMPMPFGSSLLVLGRKP